MSDFLRAGFSWAWRIPAFVAPDAFALILERKRVPGEVDRFQWYCQSCDHLLHEERFVVSDDTADPVSQAYKNFFDNVEFRTCKHCGTVMPAP